MSGKLSLEQRAKEFSTKAHGDIDQRRKYTNEPYINHPQEVVEILKTVEHTEEMLAAAWLHDVVEDTPVTITEIMREFGGYVAALVEMLTDVSNQSDGNRAKRKAIDREHTAGITPAAQTIKLADLISNTKSIKQHDPEFAKVYLAEKRLLLEVLHKGDNKLWCRAYGLAQT